MGPRRRSSSRPARRTRPRIASDRPRLVPMTEPVRASQLEFEALRTVEARLAEVGDPGFRAVRALGILPESTRSSWRRSMASRSIDSSCGVRSAPDPRSRPRSWRGRPDGGSASCTTRRRRRQVGPPGDEAGGRRRLRRVRVVPRRRDGCAPHRRGHRGGSRRPHGRLPDPLPTVITHGDFAPRNILVDGSGRLAVIDLLARWQAPPSRISPGFLVALQTSRANAATRGLLFGRTIDRLEPAFLSGVLRIGAGAAERDPGLRAPARPRQMGRPSDPEQDAPWRPTHPGTADRQPLRRPVTVTGSPPPAGSLTS